VRLVVIARLERHLERRSAGAQASRGVMEAVDAGRLAVTPICSRKPAARRAAERPTASRSAPIATLPPPADTRRSSGSADRPPATVRGAPRPGRGRQAGARVARARVA
jgi:hypothetical protein